MCPEEAGEVQQQARRHHDMSRRIKRDGGQICSADARLRKAKCVNGCSALAFFGHPVQWALRKSIASLYKPPDILHKLPFGAGGSRGK